VFDQEGEYDVVTSFSVLEHVEDPRAMMVKLASLVVPGGLLVVATPSPRSIQARLHGLQDWPILRIPEHLNILSRRGLTLLVESAGLTPIGYETLSTYVGFVKRIDPPGRPLRWLLCHVLCLLRLGADHCLTARKQ
jgi:SAM-dependent methyltransferase